MMIIQIVMSNNMPAYQLLAKLRLLTLCGQDDEGELEWWGKNSAWDGLIHAEEDIIRTWQLTNNF